MKKRVLVAGFLAMAWSVFAVAAQAAEPASGGVDQLTGNYEGMVIIHDFKQHDHQLTAEVSTINKADMTATFKMYCDSCASHEWIRKGCKVTDQKTGAKLNCESKKGSEEYVFDGEKLNGEGFGKWPFTIHMKKVAK